MSDLCLKADTEAELAAALPMFRGQTPGSSPTAPTVLGWIVSSFHHCFVPGVPIVVTPPVLDGLNVVQPAVLAEDFHANLRLSPRHPAYDEIMTAAEPFVVEPATPALTFAGEADWGIPDGCTKLGLVRVLREDGEWPAIRALLASDLDLQEDWELATELKRTDPLVQGVIAARGYPPDCVDRLIIRATAIVA